MQLYSIGILHVLAFVMCCVHFFVLAIENKKNQNVRKLHEADTSIIGLTTSTSRGYNGQTIEKYSIIPQIK